MYILIFPFSKYTDRKMQSIVTIIIIYGLFPCGKWTGTFSIYVVHAFPVIIT